MLSIVRDRCWIPRGGLGHQWRGLRVSSHEVTDSTYRVCFRDRIEGARNIRTIELTEEQWNELLEESDRRREEVNLKAKEQGDTESLKASTASLRQQ